MSTPRCARTHVHAPAYVSLKPPQSQGKGCITRSFNLVKPRRGARQCRRHGLQWWRDPCPVLFCSHVAPGGEETAYQRPNQVAPDRDREHRTGPGARGWQGLGAGGRRGLRGPGHGAPGRGRGSAKAEADLCSSRRGSPWASPRVRGLLLAKRQQEQRGERWGERGGGKVGKAGLAVSAPKEPGRRFTSSGVTEGSESGSDVASSVFFWENIREHRGQLQVGGRGGKKAGRGHRKGPPKARGTEPRTDRLRGCGHGQPVFM